MMLYYHNVWKEKQQWKQIFNFLTQLEKKKKISTLQKICEKGL